MQRGRRVPGSRSDPLGSILPPLMARVHFAQILGEQCTGAFSSHASCLTKSTQCLRPRLKGWKGAVTSVGMGEDCRLQRHEETTSTKINVLATCCLCTAIRVLIYLMLRYNTSFWLNRIIKPWFFPCPSSSLWDCIDGSFLYIATLTWGLLNPTGTPRHGRCCARPMARVAHAARRISHSSAGTQAQPPKPAAPCYSSKFLWVFIIHPKCLTRFSYKCSFTMISEFGTGMSDTCYFRLSARAGEKNSLFRLLVYKPV